MSAPQDLAPAIKELREEFTVSGETLRKISDHFVHELEKGLREKADIPMNPTWCMSFPTGHETGTFLALDMGGTNLRVVEIHLTPEQGKFEMFGDKYRLPDSIRTGDADHLWDFIAKCLADFIEKHHKGEELHDLPLGFTFSYPVTQEYIDHGVLQTWTKGFDISGVEGHDAAAQLREAMAKRNIPIKLAALINDTTGTMIASAYTDPEVKVGCIFGTGCNAAYMENCGSIPKLAERLKEYPYITDDTPMAINCEWGAFDNSHKVLPRTKYDLIIDKTSPRPNEQTFEKMIAGYYMGEILRLVLADLVERESTKLFAGQDVSKILDPKAYVDSSVPAKIEGDTSDDYAATIKLFQETWGVTPNLEELALIRELARLIGTRAARLSAAGVAGICKKKGLASCKVGADGTVFHHYPHFKARGAQALREIFGWADDLKDPIEIIPAVDGSGVGAAIIAALTMERIQAGNLAGVKAR